MLIVLSESLRAQDLRAPLSLGARDALINLATAAYEGKHLLAGSRLLFGDLQQLSALGAVVTGRFKEVSAMSADARGMQDTVAAYVQVQTIGTAPYVEGIPGAQLVFHVPLDYFAVSDRLGRSRLIGENLRDAVTYRSLGEARATQHRAFCCVLREVDGHGGSTHQTFQLLAEQDGLVLCIVDSDRSHATADLGQTAAQVLACQAHLRTTGKIAAAHVLPCRELENLLPEALVVDALPSAATDQHRVKVLAKRHCLGLVDYTELKHLVKLEQVSEHLTRLSPKKCAELCLSASSHPALTEVCTLVWSFGLAPRKGRT